MGEFLAGLLVFFAQYLEKDFLVRVAEWLAFKAFLVAFFLGIAVPVWRLIFNDIMNLTMTLVSSYVGSDSVVFRATGLAGWMLSELHMDKIISMWLAMIGLKAMLRMLPFTPVR